MPAIETDPERVGSPDAPPHPPAPQAGERKTIACLTSYYAAVSHRFIHREVARLRETGHTVHTFSLRPPNPGDLTVDAVRREYETTEHIQKAGVLRLLSDGLIMAVRRPGLMVRATRLAFRVGTPGPWGWTLALIYVVEAAHLARRLEALGVQHLHCHFGDAPATVAMLAGLLSGVPYSLTLHGPMEFDRPTLLALDEKVRRSAFSVAISDFGRSQLYRWTAFADWPKVRVVRCGVEDALLRHPRVPVPEARRLVCVGRICDQKGQLLLVEAAARLAAEGVDFELDLVGDGPMRPPVEALIARHGLQTVVRIVGWRGPDGVRDAILAARALVLPSFAEGLPVVLMEALGLGRPVISTYVAGIPELVEPGVNGWLVPAGTLDPLVAAMRAALEAPTDVLEAMGRAGARRVAERHDLASEVDELARLIDGAGPPG